MGTGLGATVAAGAISGASSGQAARATENALSGQEVTAGLGNPVDIAADAVIGGALAGVGYGIGRLARPANEICTIANITDNSVVYRGLSAEHPQLKTYLETGVVQPRGGNASLYEHVMGNTASNFTSWTKDIKVAEEFAGKGGIILQVDVSQIPNRVFNSYEWSPFWWEMEVTIEGPFHGARIFRIIK
jgi:hypothetical protein